MNPKVLVLYSFFKFVTRTAAPSGTSDPMSPPFPNNRLSHPGESGGRTPYILVSSHVASKGKRKMSIYLSAPLRTTTRTVTYDSDDKQSNDGCIALRGCPNIIGSQGDILVSSKSFREECIEHRREYECEDDLYTSRTGR